MSCSVCAGHDTYNCPVCGEAVRIETCPDCKGTGFAPYKAWHLYRHVAVEVTHLTWLMIPRDEDDALAKGENWCRMDRETCPTCKGEGEIPEHY